MMLYSERRKCADVCFMYEVGGREMLWCVRMTAWMREEVEKHTSPLQARCDYSSHHWTFFMQVIHCPEF